MIFTDAQISEVMRMAAMDMADRMEASLVETLGGALGGSVCVSVALAARIVNVSKQHIRRSLPVIVHEGAQNQVQVSYIQDYIDQRKSKTK